jgi:hypothetical protein
MHGRNRDPNEDPMSHEQDEHGRERWSKAHVDPVDGKPDIPVDEDPEPEPDPDRVSGPKPSNKAVKR